ncbi:MAG TPA: hypothetical protein PK705_10255 [Clostridia bacterium]|jgi:hypothetical protein|nr:hypothetical protein [Clostridia bacterium]
MKNPDIKLIPRDEKKLFEKYFSEATNITVEKIMALKDLAREKKTTLFKAIEDALPEEDIDSFRVFSGGKVAFSEIFDELGPEAYNKVKQYLQSL